MKLAFTFVTTLLLGLQFSAKAQCALDGYTYLGTYGGNHYYMSTTGSSWDAANAAATAAGGHLAAISSQGENDFLAQALINAGAPETGRAWIGLNDAATEGAYVWTNGEPYVYSNWAGGEPNNAHYYPNDAGEDWVEINRLGFGKWNDLPEWVTHIPHALEMDGADDDCDGLVNYCDDSFDDADCDGIGDDCDDSFTDADCDGIGDGCDDSFDDADCDGIGDDCDDSFDDADCDGIGDGCDNCAGGDDNGPCNAESFPGFDNIPEDWVCHDNGRKVFMCHEGNTICIDVNAVQAHLDHGDFLGPCVGCIEPRSSAGPQEILDLIIHPNPATDYVTIQLQGMGEPATLILLDQFGHRLRQVQVPAYTDRVELSLDQYPAGLYFIQAANSSENTIKRIIIAQ